MKTTITKVALVVMTVLLASFTTYADIVVTAPNVTMCPGTSTASISFVVTGAQNLGSISMKVSINHSVLVSGPPTFTWSSNPALAGGFVTANVTNTAPYVLAFAWFGLSATSIPDGETMVTFNVPYLGGTSPLNFLNVGVDCIFTDASGTFDIPATWINGSVSPAPTLAINTQPQSITVPQGSNANFVALSNIATTHQWQESTDGGATWNNLIEGAPYIGVSTFNLTVSSVTTAFEGYQYRCNITAPCSQSITSDAAILSVSTVVPVPTAYDMSGGGAICEGSPGISFVLSGSEADATYELYLDGVGTGYIQPGTGGVLSFDNITAPGIYTIVGTNTYGSTTMNGTGTLVVNPLPIVTLADFAGVCINAPEFLLSGGSPVGGGYSGIGVGDNWFYPSVAGAGTFEITYSYTDVLGCSASAIANLTVNELPLVSWNDVLPTICTNNGTYELTGGTPAGGVYSGTEVSGGFFNPATAGVGDFTLTYTYTDGNGCTASAINTISVISGETTTYDVTGGGTFCTGGTGILVGLNGSVTGATYELFLDNVATGNILTGNSTALDFGLQTAAGTYTVKATTTCGTFEMNGTAVVIESPMPNLYNVSGGGFACEGTPGVTVTLDGSDNGAMYFLYNGATFVGSLAGDGSPLSFGPYNTPGTYTIFGEYNIECGADMIGLAIITLDPIPTAFDVTGGGNICSGSSASLTLSNSENGVEEGGIRYTLYLDGISTGVFQIGNGSALTFDNLTEAGVYTVVAVTNCGTVPMNGSATVTILNLPSQFNINGGGNICPGDAGLLVGLSGSEVDVTYELYFDNVATGNIMAGTGSSFDFGAQIAAGSYSIHATNSCGDALMFGNVDITITSLLVINYQPGNASVFVGGNASFASETTTVSSIQWQVSTDGGANYVDLTNTAPYSGVNSIILDITGATLDMNAYRFRAKFWTPECETATTLYSDAGTLSVSEQPTIIVTAPSIDDAIVGNTVVVPITVENVSGAAAISLSLGFDPAVLTYTGYQNEDIQLSTGMLLVNQLGNNIKFGWFSVAPISIASGTLIEYLFTFNGGYSALTWDLTPGECQFSDIVPVPMAASFVDGHVTGTCPLPLAYNVTGGGAYCPTAGGTNVGLDGSEANATYELFIAGVTTGTILTGTGTALDFGVVTAGGIYTVVATNVCGTTDMTGSAEVNVLALPSIYTVSGDATGCSNDSFVIALSGSDNGATYELYKDGVPMGITQIGDGNALTFIVTETAIYTVSATDICGTVEMTGSATISIYAVPALFNVTGGGILCSGSAGFSIFLSGSETGVTYDLYLNGDATGISFVGDGNSIDFGLQTITGIYSVRATYPCGIVTMNGSTTLSAQPAISIISNPSDVTVTVGGNAVYNVTASMPGNFQWQVSTDGITYTDLTEVAPYSGVTSEQLTVTGVTADMNGYYYRASVYDPFCGITTMVYSSGALLTVNAAAEIVITAPSIDDAIVGNTVIVPITAENISGAAAISLSLGYDPTVLTYLGYQNLNAGLETGFVFINILGNNIKLGWFSIAPITIPSGTLVEYLFTFNGGYSPLTWDPTVGENQISDITPSPLNATFVDGHVTGTCPLPLAFNVTGGGSYCLADGGVVIGLDGSEANASYELFLNGLTTSTIVSGDGNALTFGLQSAIGTYTVVATNACGTTDMTGTAEVSILSLPTVFEVTGGGTICPGDGGLVISVSGSQIGVTYTLFVEGAAADGFAGDGSAFAFAPQTLAGSYEVLATNSCGTVSMNGTPTITVQSAIVFITNPTDVTVYSGANASFDASTSFGGTIQWQVSTDNGLTFNDLTNSGPYSNVTTYQLNITGVSLGMNGNLYRLSATDPMCPGSPVVYSNSALLTVNTLPVIITTAPSIDDAVVGNQVIVPITVENINGAAAISLSLGFDPSVLTYTGYQNENVVLGGGFMSVNLLGSNVKFGWFSVTPISIASGTLIEFLFTFNGGYSPLTWDLSPGQCEYEDITPSPLASTFIDGHVTGGCPLPVAFNVTGGGAYCTGTNGVNVGLDGSETDATYEIFIDGVATGITFTGTGSALELINFTTTGIYTIVATNACGNTTMTGSVTVSSLPLALAFNVTGGGTFCAGGAGVPVGLDGSENATTYELFLNGAATGIVQLGDGLALNFGSQSSTGTYTVVATNSCGSVDMTGNAVISTYAVPATFTVTGGGSYCVGGTGVAVGLDGSESGINYELYLNGIATGNILTGNGTALDFGLQTIGGTYTVALTYICGTITMTGNAVVVVNTPVFTSFNVTGGGGYCAGDAGVHIGLSGSEVPYTYEVYHNSTYTGVSLAGNGGALDFGLFTAAGGYSVKAVDICGSAFMAGGVTIVIYPAVSVYNMTGGGSYCSGSTSFPVGLDNSQVGVSYELFLNGVSTGITVSGSGGAISFGNQTAVGNYTAVGTGTCGTVPMNGTAIITTGSTITLYNVVGGGTYLAGGAGIEVSLSGSDAGVDYQLLLNGSAIGSPVAGTGSPISFGFQTIAGTYTVLGMNGGSSCQLMMNGGATVIVIPVILEQPGDTSIFAGFGASFTVNALGATIFQWQISTDGGLTFYNVPASAPFYNSTTATLNIYGAPLSFNGYRFRCLVSTPGSPIVTSNAGTLIVVTTPTLTTIAPIMTAAPGTFIAVPITVLGFNNIAAFNLTMNYDPSVMTPVGIQNENGALLTGSEFQFINTGIPGQFFMAWFSLVPASIGNGTLLEITYNFIDGSTPLIWQLTPAEGAQYGSLFGQVIPSIWINGQINSTNSIVITDQPDNATACEGGSATYSVTAPGATTYQWVITTDYGLTWMVLPESPMFVGVNTSTLTVNGVSSSISNYMFACRIDEGLATTVLSNLASLNIISYEVIPATIVAVPGTVICPGNNVTFSVSSPVDLTGAAYIWYINSIPASSAPSFSTTGLLNGDVVKVDVMLSSTCTVAEVPTVTMVVDPHPVVTSNPVDAIVVVGDDPTFSVTATSPSGALAYQWQLSTDNGITYSDLTETAPYSGVNTATLQITDATLSMDGYMFQCIVTEGLCGNTVISGSATLYVFPAPIITYAPNVVVCDEEQIIVPITVDNFMNVASMSLKLDYNPAIITYVGTQNTNSAFTTMVVTPNANQIAFFWYSIFTPITVANGDLITELVFTPASVGTTSLTWDATFGSCMYSDINGTIIPDIYVDGSVTVNALPIVYNVTGGGEYCIGGTGLPVGVSGSETGVNYELFLNGVSTGNIVAGTGSAIEFGNQFLAGTYTVVATNVTTLCVSNMAGFVTIIINPLPIVTWTNALATQCESSEVYPLIGGTPVGGTYSGPGVVGNNFNANLAGPGVHVLTYTYMDANGCVNSATNTITVLDGPTPFPVTGGGTFCQGGIGVTVGLSNSEPVIIYQLFINGVNSGSPVFGTGGVINFGYQTVPGIYTVVGLNIFNGCTAVMIGSVTVTEIIPNVTWPTSLPAICQNSSPYTLTGGLPAGGTYSGNGVVGGVFYPAIAGNGVHTLTYTYTDTYGCIGSATNSIVVNPGPDVTFSPLPDICLTGTAFDLTTYVTPVGGSFTGLGVSGSMFNPFVAGVGAHNITYTYSAGSCSVIITRSINVLPLPIVTWTNTLTSQCVDVTAYFLTGGSPAGGIYSGLGVTGNVFNPSLAGVGTHTLTYTYTDANGCTNSTTNTITVNGLPIVTWPTALADQCVNLTTYTLSGGTPAGGVYSGAGVSGTNFNPNLAGIGIHTLTYTYTDANGCVNSVTNTITVTPVPVVTFNTLPDVCYNSSPLELSLYVTPVGGTFSGTGVVGGTFNPSIAGIGIHTITYTYTLNGCTVIVSRNINVVPAPTVTWTTALAAQCVDVTAYYLAGGNPVGGFYSGPGVIGNLFNPNLVGAGTYTLTYTYTDPNSGCTGSATNTITVNPLPVVIWTTTLGSVCIDGAVVTLSGGSPIGGTYSGNGVIGTTFNPSIAGVGTHTLTYEFTDANGCSGSVNNTITVNPLPNVYFSGNFPTVCVNSPVIQLSTGSPAGGTYSGTGVIGTTFNPSVAGAGTHILTYTYTDPTTNCTNSATNSITVNSLPIVTWTGALPSVCLNESVILSGGIPAGGIYSGPGVTGNVFTATAVGTYTLTYTYTDGNNCSNTATNTITVNPLPNVTFGGTLADQCITATSYILTGGSPAGGIYSGLGVIGNNFNASVAGIGVHIITYTYTDPTTGCTNTATNTITVVTPPAVTFVWTGPTDFCINGPTVSLSGGSPVGGVYSGAGVTGTTFNPATAGVGTHIITYTYTNATGCSGSAIITFEVHPLPTVTFAGTLVPQCVTSTSYFLTGGSPGGGVYSGPGVTGNNFNASLVGVGIYTITYTYTDGFGCTNSATNTISVIGLPTVTWPGTLPTACITDPIVILTGGLPAGGVYGGPGVTGGIFNATLFGPGTFTLTYTYTDPATGCSATATNTITVNPLPTVTFGGALTSQCVSATTYLLTGGSPAGGTYSGLGVTGNNFNASVAGVGTHVITYTYTDPTTGCTNSATNTITVVNPPAVTFVWTGPTDFCINGASITLSGGSPVGGVYSGAGVTGTTFNPATAGLGSHVITYTYTNGAGCSGSATITFEVHALPSVTFGGTLVAQCLSSTTYLLTGGLPGGGTYSGAGVNGNNFNASVAGLGLHTITYTYTDGFGCTNSATNTISVVANPTVTWSNALTPQCENATGYLLSGGTPIGGVYSGPGVNGTNFNASLVGPGTYTLTYTYTNGNGCTGFATNTIVVNALPNVTWNTVLADQCKSTTVYALTGGSPAGGTYSGPGVTGTNFNAFAVGIGTYTLTYTYTNPATGCTNSTTNTITVVDNPAVFFPGILPDQCLVNTNLALTTGVPAGGTYSGPGVVGNNFNASVAGVGTWTITYTYTNAQGCTGSATNTVTVNPNPIVTWTNTLTTQCAGNTTYALTGGFPAGGTYSGPGVTGSNFDASAVGVGTYTLTYTYTNATGCSGSATNTITVVVMPTVSLGPDIGVCFGTTATLTATATPVGLVTYLWNTGAVTQTINITQGDTTTYSVTVTTSFGCTATDEIVVYPLPLPTAVAYASPITICAGESTIVGATGGSGTTPYLWNTTSTLQQFVTGPLTDTTFYTVTVMNTFGCIDIATVRVNVNMIPIVSLGPDIIACENYTVTLNPTGSTPFDNFLWNTGLETPTLSVDSTGFGLNNPATYTVTVTLNGCQAKDAVVVTFVPCPGFDEIGKVEKIDVYPNPTDGRFTVTIENYDKALTFDIYNNIGQHLFSEKLQNNSNAKYSKEFDLSRYPVGFYILRFTDGDKVKSKKLIVK